MSAELAKVCDSRPAGRRSPGDPSKRERHSLVADVSIRRPGRDRISLSYKEGWLAYVEAPRRTQPELLTRREIAALSATSAKDYNDRRADWHANIRIKLPAMVELYEQLSVVIDSSRQDGNEARPAVGIDGPASVGKTVMVENYAKQLHLKEVAEHGPMTDDGDERWPVCWVGMTGNTGLKDFNVAMLRFYNHPGSQRGSKHEFGYRALDCVLKCDTKLLIVDDLHFLNKRTTAEELSNQLKYVSNQFPVKLILVGIDLADRFLNTVGAAFNNVLEQTGRRTTPLRMDRIRVDDEAGRQDWTDVLHAFEDRIVLAERHPGMLSQNLSEYLYIRTGGVIGSLANLINRGCFRAIRTGAEYLDSELLSHVPLDSAAERGRAGLEETSAAGKLITRPTRRKRALE